MDQITNLTFIKGFSNGDLSRIKKYVEMYLQSAATEMPSIEQALAAKDWKKLKTSAHTLKSLTGYMGMSTTQQLLKKIEDAAASETPHEQLPDDVSNLKMMISQSETELKHFLAQN
jgi:HPt (histidine-containing phosphotransfer) domain-containing protein